MLESGAIDWMRFKKLGLPQWPSGSLWPTSMCLWIRLSILSWTDGTIGTYSPDELRFDGYGVEDVYVLDESGDSSGSAIFSEALWIESLPWWSSVATSKACYSVPEASTLWISADIFNRFPTSTDAIF